MKLYKRCIESGNQILIKDNDKKSLQIVEASNDQFTYPQCVTFSYDYELEWACKDIYYISDIHLTHKIVKSFVKNASDSQIKRFIKNIVKDLLSEKIRTKLYQGKSPIILFGGDISSDFEIAKIFYTEFVMQWQVAKKGSDSPNYIYAVLGNHEFWSFSNADSCYNTYKEFFQSVGIFFLDNSMMWLGRYSNPEEKPWRKIRNILIVGGVGFAGCNPYFNAENGVYKNALNREQEILETQKWKETYFSALQYAKEQNSILIVLTHNPISDWNEYSRGDSGCVYINGHSHRNNIYHDEERNIHVFANNQVGYYGMTIQFKNACIYNRVNPFAKYDDGCYKITSSEYLQFYDYIQENISGNGLVERQLKNKDAHFYMIKHSGYYGFFLTSPKGTYICAGGHIKKISERIIIDEINSDFINMVKTYLKKLSPYRNAQEEIAGLVKSFGGEGKIHGCIIDIDFYNHIMLNPYDGSVTYYFSPIFGQVEVHDNLLSLLENHNKMLAEKYKIQIGSSDKKEILPVERKTIKRMIQIDIKNSVYDTSNRVNQLQRLFDKKILRDWNKDLLASERDLLLK